MCRAGGRRCEHNWSEAQHQADLARRRAIYAQKATKPGMKLTAGTEAASSSSPVTPVGAQLTSCIKNFTQKKQSCNLTFVTKDEENQEFQAYNETVITGQIDPQALNDKSYQVFGFQGADRWKDTILLDAAIQKAKHVSRTELPALTPREKLALAVFTTDSYEDINQVLYEDPSVSKCFSSKSPTVAWDFSGDDSYTLESETAVQQEETGENDVESGYLGASMYARKLNLVGQRLTGPKMVDYVNTVDEAFSKADGRQRIVYRGERFLLGQPRFGDHRDMQSYVDSNFKVGNQITFKGMQSTSMEESQAQEYASSTSGSIIYEISTPSGIGVSAVSSYEEECEVLLPRNSRYQVVGKTHIDLDGTKQAVIQLVEVDEDNNIRHAGNLRKKDEFGEFDITKFY